MLARRRYWVIRYGSRALRALVTAALLLHTAVAVAVLELAEQLDPEAFSTIMQRITCPIRRLARE